MIQRFSAVHAPAVAALFQRVFRRRSSLTELELARHIESSFLGHPWFDPELPSWVYVRKDSAVQGFIGTYPIQFVLNGRPIRAAIASSAMVDNRATNPWIGARLVRSFLSGPQDLSLAETANITTESMWESLGAQALGMYSLDWVCVVKPISTVLAWIGDYFPPAAAARPLGAIADNLLCRTSVYEHLKSRSRSTAATNGRDASEEEFVDSLLTLSTERRLRPAWNPEVLRWLLAQAEAKNQYGANYRRLVFEPTGQLIGAYAVYAQGGRVARVLQILARPGKAGAVLDNLIGFVLDIGTVAVRGRSEPEIFNELRTRRCILVPAGAFLAHTRCPEIWEALRSGSAIVTGLAGETWTPLIGNNFNRARRPKRATALPAHKL